MEKVQYEEKRQETPPIEMDEDSLIYRSVVMQLSAIMRPDPEVASSEAIRHEVPRFARDIVS